MLVGQRAEPGGAGAEPVAGGLWDVLGLAFQGERAFTQLGGLDVGTGCLGSALFTPVVSQMSTPSLFEHPMAELSGDGLALLGEEPGNLIT
jgi:hypothetical protein